MHFHKEGEDRYLVVLKRGEKVMAELTEFCIAQKISAASLAALGAVKNIELGYYRVDTKQYYWSTHEEDHEAASFVGNVALVDGKPFIHGHGTFAPCTEGGAVIAGHVKEMEVAATLEVCITSLQMPLYRAYDEETGLKLIQPDATRD